MRARSFVASRLGVLLRGQSLGPQSVAALDQLREAVVHGANLVLEVRAQTCQALRGVRQLVRHVVHGRLLLLGRLLRDAGARRLLQGGLLLRQLLGDGHLLLLLEHRRRGLLLLNGRIGQGCLRSLLLLLLFHDLLHCMCLLLQASQRQRRWSVILHAKRRREQATPGSGSQGLESLRAKLLQRILLRLIGTVRSRQRLLQRTAVNAGQ
mmetsp:Transcript_86452/g.234449  ORF Transcript_86452/g.234449 Transcript_86452/m.234449 type:complete len:209 (+) Transcript_86452:168-794(+)